MLNNELLTPSHAEVKTQGDLKASVAALQTRLESRIRGIVRIRNWPNEIDDLRRGAPRLSAEWQGERDSLIPEQKALNVQAALERLSLVFLLGQLQSR
jgi:hypothetical protein